MALEIIIPVWGPFYCHTLTTFLLPSLLAPGNLPCWSEPVSLHLLTTAQDLEVIQSHGVLKPLKTYCQLELTLFDPVTLQRAHAQKGYPDKYTLISLLLSQAFQAAALKQADVIPLMADMVLSDGLFRYLRDCLARGVRLLLHPSPRVQLEAMSLALFRWRQGFSLTAPARDFARETIYHLHPHERACFLDTPHFTNWPSHFYIPEPPGVYAHCLHMHPMYMHQPCPLPAGEIHSIDVGFLYPYAKNPQHIEVASNQYFSACSLSNPEDDFQVFMPQGPDPGLSRFDLIRLMLSHAHPLHQQLFWQGVYYDMSPAQGS